MKIRYPIAVYGEIARYRSAAEAAKALGKSAPDVLRAATERRRIGNNLILYADMPVDCQSPRDYYFRQPVIWEGVEYPSILAASKGDRALYMRISRARRKALEKRKEPEAVKC